MPLNLNIPQFEFYSMDKPFRAFVAGYRGGKTFLGCVRLCVLALEYPGIRLGYFAPTYPQIRDIFYTTMSDVAELVGMTVEVVTSKNEVKLFYHGELHATVKCRSMEHPARIVGFDINHALIDEIDCMKREKADAAWKKIVARLSSSGFDEARLYDEEMDCELIIEALGDNTVDFTTTPEGFNWIYNFFVKQLREDESLQQYYGIVNASSRQNAKNLPDNYIDKLEATYSPALVNAYVDGKFVNLTTGSVYTQFDRILNSTKREWNGSEPIYIGMDFNVGRMCCVIHVIDDGKPYAVGEITGAYDTPDMIRMIRQRYWTEISSDDFQKDCQISVYPDSSGKSRKSVGACDTDISLLEDAGFNCYYNGVNPAIRDRVNAMNGMFCNSKQERRYLVNTSLCKNYTDKLEQQAYRNGEPDKDGTEDVNDAGGYFIAYEYPINRAVTQIDISFAM